MALIPLKMVDEIEPRSDYDVGYAISPKKLYPFMVAHVLKSLKDRAKGSGAIREVYFPLAERVPEDAWALVLTDRAEIDDSPFGGSYATPDSATPSVREVREHLMFICSRWFAEVLHQSVGGDGTLMNFRISPKSAAEKAFWTAI